jgi:hypothetical protein
MKKTYKPNPERSAKMKELYAQYTALKIMFPKGQAGYAFVKYQLEQKGLMTYEPNQDVKTFNGWKAQGYQVQKGMKADIFTVVWKVYDKEKNEKTGKMEKVESTNMRPVLVALFHRGQVKKVQEETVTINYTPLVLPKEVPVTPFEQLEGYKPVKEDNAPEPGYFHMF